MDDLQSRALDYLDWLRTVSVALTLMSVAALMLRRYYAAAVGFLALGAGALAIVWDSWSARAGHHMELTALVEPVALSSRETFLLATHLPLLLAGLALLALRRSASAGRGRPRRSATG